MENDKYNWYYNGDYMGWDSNHKCYVRYCTYEEFLESLES